jgi:pimeloyl-ACP methyl ester carboxylesterase
MLKIAALLVVLYLALCAVVFVKQRSLLYFPQPRANVEGATSFTLPVDGAEVVVTTRLRRRAPAVLYFGGNAEDVASSLPELAAAFPDHALYLLHYRGYGGSTGEPAEGALVADAQRLYERVSSDHPSIVVVGRSLGSGIAVRLASSNPIARLVLMTPYDSIEELAVRHYPFLPVRWMLHDKFEAWRAAPSVTAPTLLIAAENDEVIPKERAAALLTHFAKGVARLEVLAGAGHNTLQANPRYVALLRGEK